MPENFPGNTEGGLKDFSLLEDEEVSLKIAPIKGLEKKKDKKNQQKGASTKTQKKSSGDKRDRKGTKGLANEEEGEQPEESPVEIEPTAPAADPANKSPGTSEENTSPDVPDLPVVTSDPEKQDEQDEQKEQKLRTYKENLRKTEEDLSVLHSIKEFKAALPETVDVLKLAEYEETLLKKKSFLENALSGKGPLEPEGISQEEEDIWVQFDKRRGPAFDLVNHALEQSKIIEREAARFEEDERKLEFKKQQEELKATYEKGAEASSAMDSWSSLRASLLTAERLVALEPQKNGESVYSFFTKEQGRVLRDHLSDAEIFITKELDVITWKEVAEFLNNDKRRRGNLITSISANLLKTDILSELPQVNGIRNVIKNLVRADVKKFFSQFDDLILVQKSELAAAVKEVPPEPEPQREEEPEFVDKYPAPEVVGDPLSDAFETYMQRPTEKLKSDLENVTKWLEWVTDLSTEEKHHYWINDSLVNERKNLKSFLEPLIAYREEVNGSEEDEKKKKNAELKFLFSVVELYEEDIEGGATILLYKAERAEKFKTTLEEKIKQLA